MNNKVRAFVRNFSYTLTANLISVIISTLIVLIMPKLMGVENYGYWQLYLFYASYVSFLQFGWNDGIYLRYGGKEYDELDKKLFFSQFWMLTIFQLVLTIALTISSYLFVKDVEKQFILIAVAFCMILIGIRAMLLYILQGANRIKEYAMITIMDRTLYCVIIIMLLFGGFREYKVMVLADLSGKLISLLYSMYRCKDIVFLKWKYFRINYRETFENIRVGIKLMFSNIASMLIMGVIRFGIERFWDVSVFGKISLTLSVSNLMMLFINAVGIIMYPILRRTNQEKLPNIYVIMRDFLMVALFGCLIIYYPLKVVLSAWLPEYSESLMYMALVFPICVYEGKMILLVNTYLKTLRKEKLMLQINFLSLVLSILITSLTTFYFKNLDAAILSIVIVLAFRCILAEICLSYLLKISVLKEIVLDSIMVAVFISSGWLMDSWGVLIVYGCAYVGYILIKREGFINTIKQVKLLGNN